MAERKIKMIKYEADTGPDVGLIPELSKLAWGIPAKKMNCWLCEKPMDTKEKSVKLINGEPRAMHVDCSEETYPEIREWKPFQSKM